jgi:iron complex outermembrane receptor protein
MKRLSGLLQGACLVACFSAVAEAQTPTVQTDDAGVDEIVVTAQKRAQSLQDVPLSIAALGAETLIDRNITEISQLQTATPNFSFAASNNPRGAGITIRGIGTNNFSSAIEGSVGIVIDGVPIGRQGGGFADLFDVERIEILRGPQGTLFGKNASAGVLNIVTQNPKKEFEARAHASFGEDDEAVLRAAVTGPIAETIAARLSLYHTGRDGPITNVADGTDLNNRNEWGMRGKLLFEPQDNLSFVLAADYSERDAACCIWTTRIPGTNAGLRASQAAAGIVPGPDNRKVNIGGGLFIEQEIRGVSLQADWTLGNGVTLTSITAGRWWDAIDNNDADQQLASILDVNNGDSVQEQLTQELRATSPDNDTFEWVLGLFAFQQQYDLQNTQQGTFGVPLPPGAQLSRRINVSNETNNYAVFGDASWTLSRPFTIFAGARYTQEDLTTQFRRAAVPGTALLGGVANQTANRDDTAWSWRLGGQFRPTEDIMLYASASRGFKGGGFNALQDSPTLRTVEPEIPTAYEIGVRSEWFDRRLRLNASAFRTDFDDFQVQAVAVSPAGTLFFDVVNAGELRTEGLEVELQAEPAQGLTFDLGMAFTDASYLSFPGAPCYAGQTAALGCIGTGGTSRQDLKNRPLANAPEFTAAASVRYERPVNDAVSAFAALSASHRGDTFTALDLDPRSLQKAYTLIDAQIGLAATDSRYRLWVWGKNLGDEQFSEAIFDTPFDAGGQSQFIPLNAERQLGVSLEFRF